MYKPSKVREHGVLVTRGGNYPSGADTTHYVLIAIVKQNMAIDVTAPPIFDMAYQDYMLDCHDLFEVYSVQRDILNQLT